MSVYMGGIIPTDYTIEQAFEDGERKGRAENMEKIYELIDNRILELMREQRQTHSNKVYDRCIERIGELIIIKSRLLEVENNGTTTNSR